MFSLDDYFDSEEIIIFFYEGFNFFVYNTLNVYFYLMF
ncbi:hypothetical protein BCW_C0006 (plasmid) [Bacillus cereus W]|nr:hypothetical protein BCW_C0006 [Bacillus cereus W]